MVGIVEAQVDYVLRLLDHIVRDDIALAPREGAARAWLEGVREKARGSVWASGGCQSWYLDKTGTPSIDPSTLTELEAQLAKIDLADFNEHPRRPAPTS